MRFGQLAAPRRSSILVHASVLAFAMTLPWAHAIAQTTSADSAAARKSHATGGDTTTPKAKDPKPASSKDPKPTETIHFNHNGCRATAGVCSVSYKLDLNDGDTFAVQIDSTQTNNFIYNIAGFEIAAPSRDTRNATPYDTTVLTQKHDKKYGGYLVTIRHKPGVTSTLPDATLLISVATRSWALSFGGGYSISSLVDRVYALHDTTVGGATQKVVRQERDHQDYVRPATATFIHAYESDWPHLAWSFGLGVGDGNTTYFLGPSYRFGDVGAFTLGAVFGPQKDLPAGTRVGQLTTDANAVANLVPRNRIGAFIAFSYSFLSSGQSDFQKPVKGTDAQSGGAAAGGGGGGEGGGTGSKTTDVTLKPDPTSGLAPGSTVKFEFTLSDASAFPGGKIPAAKFSITPDADTKKNFSAIPDDVDVTPAADGKSATGSFQATLASTVSGVLMPKFTLDYNGTSINAMSSALSIKQHP